MAISTIGGSSGSGASVGQNLVLNVASAYAWYSFTTSIKAGAYALTKSSAGAIINVFFYNGTTLVASHSGNVGNGTVLNVAQDCTKVVWQSDTVNQVTYAFSGVYGSTGATLGSVTPITTTGSVTFSAPVQVMCLGGGGGGGNATNAGNSAGGGGGSGYLAYGVLQAGTYTATIGAGASAVGIGGTTSIGTISAAGGNNGITGNANGGAGGAGGSNGGNYNGGVGGSNGSPGSGVQINNTYYATFGLTPGSGGTSAFPSTGGGLYAGGGGGQSGTGTQNGGAGTNYGGGGAGAGSQGSNATGGAGYQGAIWYRTLA